MDSKAKFGSLIDEIDTLIGMKVTAWSSEFEAWKVDAERFLTRQFGKESVELEAFKNTKFLLINIGGGFTHHEQVEKCRKGLATTKLVFQRYLDDLREVSIIDNNKVFIAHGHDEKIKFEIAYYIAQQGYKTIILGDLRNEGVTTIIEKLLKNSDVGKAVCLFTADDETKESYRARQNVVFETGFFIGTLKRENVIIVCDRNIEIPSDIEGVAVIYTDENDWKTKVINELKSDNRKEQNP